MDKQETQSMFVRLLNRFARGKPKAMLIYGRRAVPAPGFSMAEVEEAGVPIERARELGIEMDPQRMSSLGANVNTLKNYLKRREG